MTMAPILKSLGRTVPQMASPHGDKGRQGVPQPIEKIAIHAMLL
jgi:hypothetical protein